ncbi:ECF transporter S component [Marmoricola sp. RAF53]|uniref:ECF transporter S component n=1 Tax=Marmoricola sp. RAF53 TaxID=3233059 RepID=UPI003F9675B1
MSTSTRVRPVKAIALRPRSTAAIALAVVAGVLAFCWPLFMSADSALAGNPVAPLVLGLLLPVILAVVLVEISEGGLDPKAVAMLGVLSAVGAALRPLGAGTAGLETVFFLLVLAGRVFGAGFGFVLGATTLFGSALITGGVGPWLPYQMLAAALVGLGAGLLPPLGGRAEVLLLATYGLVAGLLYGLLMNLSFWPFTVGEDTQLSFVAGAPVAENLHRFVVYSVTTALGWDLVRGITNFVLIVVTGPAILATLRRAARKAAFR